MNSQTAGNTPDDKIITLIKELTKSRINWKKLLRKYCVQATETEYTFNNPDRRLIYTGGIYPGATKSDTSKDLGMIKICMDTSGSVSEKDLNEFYGQVRQLLKSYKLDAEVIYWDSEIASKGKMSTIKELYSLEIKGGGGTNPNCLFEYFDSKQCKLKPNLILIFTDGYFWDDSYKESWVHKYKNTIWVMSREYNKEFKPRFGKLTQAEFK
jgi:predicted metal-dependent peptidase